MKFYLKFERTERGGVRLCFRQGTPPHSVTLRVPVPPDVAERLAAELAAAMAPMAEAG